MSDSRNDRSAAESSALRAEMHWRRTAEESKKARDENRRHEAVITRLVKRAEAAAVKSEASARKQAPVVIGTAAAAAALKGKMRVFNPARQNEYLAHRFDGKWPSQAAKLVGVTMADVVKLRRISPEFVEQETLAENLVAERAAQAMVDMMHNDPRAATWVAKHFNPDKYGDKAAELKITGQIDHVQHGDPDSEIRQIMGLLAERRALSLPAGDDPDVIEAEVIDPEY